MLVRLMLLAMLSSPLVAQHPNDGKAYHDLGVAHLRANQPAEAIRAFGKACELAPEDPDNCYFLGRSLFMMGRYADARQPFEKALRQAAPTALSRLNRAVALNFIGLSQPAEAEVHFRAALNSLPGDPRLEDDPRIDYGAFLVREGRTKEGLPLLQEAVKAHGRSARANAELGRALLNSGDAEDAAKHLETALTLDPSAWAVRLLLGRAYLQLGRHPEAERELQLGRQGWRANQETPPTK